LEIIDHHRVGDLQTISPIYFHNEPVGSTCTLVAEKFFSSRLVWELISRVVIVRYPERYHDIQKPYHYQKGQGVAAELQKISGLEPLEWGKQIFDHTLNTEGKSDEELITSDLKEYTSGSTIFANAQIETIDMKRFAARRESLARSMDELAMRRGYDFLGLMVTDILEEGTEMLIAGEKSYLAERAFGSQSSAAVPS
jgi:manganese-dependent inorganic pyrophosphatase